MSQPTSDEHADRPTTQAAAEPLWRWLVGEELREIQQLGTKIKKVLAEAKRANDRGTHKAPVKSGWFK